MKRGAWLLSVLIIVSMITSSTTGTTAYGFSQGHTKKSSASSSSSANLLSGLFKGNNNLAGGTPSGSGANASSVGGKSPVKAQPSTTSTSNTLSFGAYKVIKSYSTALAEWNRNGIRSASKFETVIQPRAFKDPKGPIHLLSEKASHGYGASVFSWTSDIPYVGFNVYVPKDGLYWIRMDYYNDSGSIIPIGRGIMVNGHYPYLPAGSVNLSKLWRDASAKFAVDQLGNELPPEQVEIGRWQSSYAMENTYLHDQPLLFHFKAGTNQVRLTNISGSILLGNVYVENPVTLQGYAAYASQHQKLKVVNHVLSVYEAEQPIDKSDPSIQAQASADAGVTPFRPGQITLNTLGGTSWENGGQSVSWMIRVSRTGNYHLAFKYMQSVQVDMPTFRSLLIDGTVPFSQALRISFPYTSSWKNDIVGTPGGLAYNFYLTKGNHVLTLVANPAPYDLAIRTINSVMHQIDQLSIELKMVTGNTFDENRDWNITTVMPDLGSQLHSYAIQLQTAYHFMLGIGHGRASAAQSLMIAANTLETLSKNPEQVPYRYSELTLGPGSVNELLGNLLSSIPSQPLQIDRFYVYANDALPSANAGFFATMKANIIAFFRSFTTHYSVMGRLSPDALTIWVNRPREYVSLMQEMADQSFTKQTGIKVVMSIMPDEQKLILANASGQTPDVALGINNAIPFNMGVRGALANLAQFPDFQTVMRRFSPGAMLPFMFNGNYYAIPETQNFWVMYYRKDILAALGLKIPQTWHDVINMLPVLRRYGMNFYDPVGGAGGYKPFYTTLPFIYQSGGSLFTANGLHTAIDSNKAVNGFTSMTKLFTTYGLPLQVPNFYTHFRQGDLPIGISDFNTYVQLQTAAPELNGLWGIAPIPGNRDKVGKIARWATGTGEADIIFKAATHQKEAWEFLKWWTSRQTQTTFSSDMQTIYGPAYAWPSSNLQSFDQLPWPRSDIKVIMQQWKWLKDVPHVPGDYMIERELSNAYNAVVFNGENPRMAIDDAAVSADREMLVQLQELGFVGPNGNVIKAIHIPAMGR